MTLATPPFRKILRGHVQTVPANMLVKFNSLTVMSIIYSLWATIRQYRGVYREEVDATCVQFGSGSGGKNSTLKGEEFPQIYGS